MGAAITDHASARAMLAAHGHSDFGYGPSVADQDVATLRALRAARGRRLYPALHAAVTACSRLRPLRTPYRTGVVLATSSADRHAISSFTGAFLEPCEGECASLRRLDLLVAVSRFVPGGLLQDVAEVMGAHGPEVCVPGDCGIAPLALARLFVDSGRADAMVVVAVDPAPQTPGHFEAVALVIEQPSLAERAIAVPRLSAGTTQAGACLAAFGNHLARAPAADAKNESVPWAPTVVQGLRRMSGTPGTPGAWLDGMRRLVDWSCAVAGTTEVALIAASFLDLCPEHALQALRHGPSAIAADAYGGEVRFAGALRSHAAQHGWRGPFINVAGIPGAAMTALAIGEDLIGQKLVPAVAVVAGDWMGYGISRALQLLECPEKSHLRPAGCAIILRCATGASDHRRLRALLARRNGCDNFGIELEALHAPSGAAASGCTGQDMQAAENFIRQQWRRPAGEAGDSCEPRDARFLGADALVCLTKLMEEPGAAAVSVRNELGGSGLVLVDAARDLCTAWP